jgi:hypothetical protein
MLFRRLDVLPWRKDAGTAVTLLLVQASKNRQSKMQITIAWPQCMAECVSGAVPHLGPVVRSLVMPMCVWSHRPYLTHTTCRCKVEVGQVLKTESGEITVDNRCWIRSGHTLTQVSMAG